MTKGTVLLSSDPDKGDGSFCRVFSVWACDLFGSTDFINCFFVQGDGSSVKLLLRAPDIPHSLTERTVPPCPLPLACGRAVALPCLRGCPTVALSRPPCRPTRGRKPLALPPAVAPSDFPPLPAAKPETPIHLPPRAAIITHYALRITH